MTCEIKTALRDWTRCLSRPLPAQWVWPRCRCRARIARKRQCHPEDGSREVGPLQQPIDDEVTVCDLICGDVIVG